MITNEVIKMCRAIFFKMPVCIVLFDLQGIEKARVYRKGKDAQVKAVNMHTVLLMHVLSLCYILCFARGQF